MQILRDLGKINFGVMCILGVNAVSPEHIGVGGGKGAGVGGIGGVGADDDDLTDVVGGGFVQKLLGLLGSEPFLVVEVTVRVDEIIVQSDIIA